MEVSGQPHAPITTPPGKRPRYPLDRRMSGPHSQAGLGGDEKESLPLPEIEPQSSSL
jgi:hypothetical protein